MTTTTERLLALAEAYAQKAAALRLAAEALGESQVAAKRNGMPAVVKSASKVRRKQRPAPESEPHIIGNEAPTPENDPIGRLRQLSPHAATTARRAAKAEVIVAILRAHGKPMPIRDLSAAARARGLGGLTGINGLVKTGVLTARGKKGRRTYSAA